MSEKQEFLLFLKVGDKLHRVAINPVFSDNSPIILNGKIYNNLIMFPYKDKIDVVDKEFCELQPYKKEEKEVKDDKSKKSN